MTVLSSFEILSENLVPTSIIPSGPDNPLLIQGYFTQISLSPGATVSSVNFNLIFQETTGFTQGAGKAALKAQVIDAAGKVNVYNQFFASTGNGFLNQTISSGQTLIYGVQIIAGLSSTGVAASPLPQAGTGWRGTVQVNSSSPGALIATPTQRLVYFDVSNPKSPTLLTATVYSLPTAGGGTTI